MKPDNDPVNHPSHYTQGKVECIEAIEAALGPQGFIAFLRGQVIKYNWRLGKKDLPVQDSKKALWYGELLVKKLQEDAEEPQFRRQDDVKAVPTTQGEVLTEKKVSHDDSNRNTAARTRNDGRFRLYSDYCECPSCTVRRLSASHRSQP